MERNQRFVLMPTAGVLGLLTAYSISISLYKNQLHTLLDWTSTLALLTLGFGFLYSFVLPEVWKKFRDTSTTIKLWGVFLAILSAVFFNFNTGLFVLFLLVGLCLTYFTLSSLAWVLTQRRALLFLAAWALSVLASFFIVGFLKNFYPSPFEFLLLTVIVNILLTVLFESLMEQLNISQMDDLPEKIIPFAVVMLGFLLIILTARLVLHYPGLFPASFFLPPASRIPGFFGIVLLSQGWAAWTLQKLDATGWQTSRPFQWILRNLPGLVLAGTVSIATYLLATALVRYDPSRMDIFFQMDSPWWLNFLTLQPDQLLLMRAVHPFVLLILRPPVWLISVFLNGDKYHAALLLNATFSAVCVFLAWLFFKIRTGNTTYALLMAALLGVSTAHLALGSFLESYIYSGAALITFILLLQSKEDRFPQVVLAGLVTFGITITNFIQTCIGLFLVRKDKLIIFKYVAIVVALAVLLAFVQNTLYPTSDPFFIASKFKAEKDNIKDYQKNGPARAAADLVERTNAMFRNTFLFSIVAPHPIVRIDEPGCIPFCIRVMRRFGGQYHYASYAGMSSLLARTWFLGFIAAGVIFVWSFFKSSDRAVLQIVLLLNILFNFALHVKYGDDPLLYTPDWTYALVFFFGISFERCARKKWWQILLLTFIGALLIITWNSSGQFLKPCHRFSHKARIQQSNWILMIAGYIHADKGLA